MTSHEGALSSWIFVVAVVQSPSLCSQSVHRYACVCVCVGGGGGGGGGCGCCVLCAFVYKRYAVWGECVCVCVWSVWGVGVVLVALAVIDTPPFSQMSGHALDISEEAVTLTGENATRYLCMCIHAGMSAGKLASLGGVHHTQRVTFRAPCCLPAPRSMTSY